MNIVLVVFDTLRKDCCGVYGEPYWGEMIVPNFKSFARESLVMTRAYPEALPTLPTRRALYTGQRVYPFRCGDIRLKGDFSMPGWGPILESQHTMAEILSQAGRRTALISDVFHMFKPSKNFWRGFEEWRFIRGQEMDPARSGPCATDEEIESELGGMAPDGAKPVNVLNRSIRNMRGRENEEDYFVAQVFQDASKWIQQNQDADNFFLTIESFSPHEWWYAPEHYKQLYLKDPERAKIMGQWEDPSIMRGLGTRYLANYAGLTTLCDRWFGHFMETLRVTGRLDDTMIIFTSDHGHSIGDDGTINKRGYQSRPEVFQVPLMVRFPGAEHAGTKSDMFVQHHDISAEILKNAKVEPPEPIHGVPFLDDAVAGKPGQRDHVTVGWSEAVTVVRDNWWMNCKIDGKGAFLYDLDSEDAFKKNLVAENMELAKKMFELAKQDANGPYPDFLMGRAINHKNWPGGVDLV
jgi:arylsulfatase A-like enzyme